MSGGLARDLQRLAAISQTPRRRGTQAGGVPSSRIERTRDLASAGLALWQLGTDLFEKSRKKFAPKNFTISVEEGDDLFMAIQAWLIDHLPPGKMRDVTALTYQNRKFTDEWDYSRKVPHVLTLTSSDGEAHPLILGGRRVTVEFREPEYGQAVNAAGGQGGGGGQPAPVRASKAKLVFTSSDRAGYDQVVDLMRELVDQMNQVARPSRVFTGTSWGGWEKLQGESRPLHTVILRDGIKEVLVGDVERFLGQEIKYTSLGIPYHRGYLLHGPPGTGKTSLVRAIASHLHLDLYYVSLADLSKDADVTLMLNRLEPRSVLLLEDIDSVDATVTRDEKAARKARRRMERAGITMTGILNNLDGAVTPHGLIVFMSTNHRDRLDPALLRKGRVDVDQLIDYLNAEQLGEITRRFIGEEIGPLPDHLEMLQIAPADVVEVIKMHLDSPSGQDAVEEIRALVKTREAEVVAGDSSS